MLNSRKRLMLDWTRSERRSANAVLLGARVRLVGAMAFFVTRLNAQHSRAARAGVVVAWAQVVAPVLSS